MTLAYSTQSLAMNHGQGNQRRNILKTESMQFEGGTVVDIAAGIAVDTVADMEALRTMTFQDFEEAVEAVEAVCYILAARHNPTIFAHTDSADRTVDREAVERAAEGSDSHAAGTEQMCNRGLVQQNLALESWMGKATGSLGNPSDSVVAGNDSPPWLTIIL